MGRAETVERGCGVPVYREGKLRAAEQAAVAAGVGVEKHADGVGVRSESVLAGAMPPPPARPSVRAIYRVDTVAAVGGEAGPSHLATALGWLRRFVAMFPSRQLSVAHEGPDDVHAAAYKEETFRLFGEFVRTAL
ncbi:MAG: hypothetical protein SGPRY_014586 [Prymnesium sp.]